MSRLWSLQEIFARRSFSPPAVWLSSVPSGRLKSFYTLEDSTSHEQRENPSRAAGVTQLVWKLKPTCPWSHGKALAATSLLLDCLH